jgi:hypothetical protein
VSPVTVIGLAEPVAVKPPGLEITVYPVIAEPPLLTGAANVTVAWALPAVADTPVGAPGTVVELVSKIGFLHVVKKILLNIRNRMVSSLLNMIISFKMLNG